MRELDYCIPRQLIIFEIELTNELDGLWEEAGEVLIPVIGDRDLHVAYAAGVLKHIWQVWCHVQDVLKTKNHFMSLQALDVYLPRVK